MTVKTARLSFKISLGLLILFVSLIIGLSTVMAKNHQDSSLFILAVLAALLTYFSVMGLGIALGRTVKIGPDTYLIDKRNFAVSQPAMRPLEVWEKSLSGFVWVKAKDVYREIRMSVSPITPNPKVRTIKYVVNVAAHIVSLEAFRRFLTYTKNEFHLTEAPDDIARYVGEHVKFWLYEFNNAHSKEIGDFYNPMDPSQQKMFLELVSGFLDEKLQHLEIVVQSATFNIAQAA